MNTLYHILPLGLILLISGCQNINRNVQDTVSKPLVQQSPEFLNKTYTLNYGSFIVEDTFTDKSITFNIISNSSGPHKGTVPYQYEALGDGKYILSWEEQDGSTVVHFDDFKNNLSRSYWTTPQNKLIRMKGTIKLKNDDLK